MYTKVLPFGVPLPARLLLTATGITGISWFPFIEFPCRPLATNAAALIRGQGQYSASPLVKVSDSAEPFGISRFRFRPCCLPISLKSSALQIAFSKLNTQPACAPVNASVRTLRYAPHDSGSEWFAIPSLCDSFLHYSTPVCTSAPGETAYRTLPTVTCEN